MTNDLARPTATYYQLIIQALETSPEKKLSSAEICQYIAANYTFYNLEDRYWQVFNLFATKMFFCLDFFFHSTIITQILNTEVIVENKMI